MGQDADQALTQVEQARAALETDLTTLLDRLPPAAMLARGAAAGGGGLVAAGIAGKVLSARSSKRKDEKRLTREAQIQARAIAAAFQHAHVPAFPSAPVTPPKPKPKPKVAEPTSLGTAADAVADDDDSGRLGILVLLLALVAAVAAVVARQKAAEDDIWLDSADR